MAVSPETIAFLEDQLSGVGLVSIRRMFGGAGIFAEGLMFALVVEDVLYFKVDASTLPEFEAEGSEAFSYQTKIGRHFILSYWRAPEHLYDDREVMTAWARAAVAAAQRAQKPKARGAKSRGKNR